MVYHIVLNNTINNSSFPSNKTMATAITIQFRYLRFALRNTKIQMLLYRCEMRSITVQEKNKPRVYKVKVNINNI